MRQKLISILLNPFFIAFTISLIIIYFLPDYFTKYKIELVNQDMYNREFKVYFEDLNNDNVSEKILCYYNTLGKASYEIHSPEGDLINVFDFSYNHASLNKLWFFDLNNNGYNEIYLFTIKGDSVYLNIEEPFVKNGIHKKNIFIDITKEYSDKFIVRPSIFGISDVNEDGVKELFFTLNSGFSGYPRNAYKYDLSSNQIYKSPHLTNPSHIFQIIDLDNDGSKEIIIRNRSANNDIDESYTQRSDHSSWLLILDKNLNFRFDPIEFKSPFSSVFIIPIKSNDQYNLLCYIDSRQSDNYPDKLCIYSNRGRLLKEKEIPPENLKLFSNLNDFLLYNRDNGTMQKFNFKLEELSSFDIDSNYSLFPINIDKDEKKEWIGFKKNQTDIVIYNDDFKETVKFKIPNSSRNDLNYGIKSLSKSKNEIYFQKGHEYFVYQYFKNPAYPFRYFIYIGVFLLVLALVWLIQIGQKIRMKKQIAIEKQISELQIKTIKNQVDPHFVFNAVNTISEMMLTDDKIEADRFITRFSKLMRETLQNSDKILTSLQEEIDYTENYIELQKIRFSNSFDYEIIKDLNIDYQTMVPKHVLYSYVENAIKHGLSVKSKNGRLIISTKLNSKGILLTIEDNGEGIIESKNNFKNSTGSGVKIMEEMFVLYEKLYNKKIKHRFIELEDDNKNKIGSKVEILISK